jgi:hypothetical protein
MRWQPHLRLTIRMGMGKLSRSLFDHHPSWIVHFRTVHTWLSLTLLSLLMKLKTPVAQVKAWLGNYSCGRGPTAGFKSSVLLKIMSASFHASFSCNHLPFKLTTTAASGRTTSTTTKSKTWNNGRRPARTGRMGSQSPHTFTIFYRSPFS